MPYLLIDDFAGGLDTRKSALTSPAGTLQRLNDCVITPGGEIAKRKAFVQVADLTGTFGLAATESTVYAFTRGVAMTAPPSIVPDVGMVFQTIPNTSPTMIQTDFDTFNGKIYLACSDGSTSPHYYDGVLTEGANRAGYYVRTYGTKMYGVAGKNLFFSAVGDPMNWTTGTGAGFINLSMQDADGELLVSLEIYYDKMSIFSSEATQIWSVDPDPLQNVLDQVLRGAGTISPQSSLQYGSGDVLYLSRTGICSIKARDASNSGAVSDIGSPVDLDIQNLYSANGSYWFSGAQALLEPILGRFWMIFPDQIYVLSYFPGPKITAWSRYNVPFTVGHAVTCGGHVFLRSGNALYAYGGADGNTYDATVGEVRLPYLDMKRPGHNKLFEALDMTVNGTWVVKNSFAYGYPDSEETIGTFIGPTWRGGRAEFTGESSHFSLRFYTSGTGPATLSNAAVHYRLADEEFLMLMQQLELPLMPMIDDANFTDLRFLAINLRPEDVLELSVTRDLGRFEDLAWSAAYSRWHKVAIWNRRPVFAFGASQIERQPKVQVWGFGSLDAVHAIKPVTRYIRKFMIPEILRAGTIEAQAISHPANTISHRWLQFLGFRLKATITGIGPRKQDMLLFTVSADDLARFQSSRHRRVSAWSSLRWTPTIIDSLRTAKRTSWRSCSSRRLSIPVSRPGASSTRSRKPRPGCAMSSREARARTWWRSRTIPSSARSPTPWTRRSASARSPSCTCCTSSPRTAGRRWGGFWSACARTPPRATEQPRFTPPSRPRCVNNP